MSKMEVKLITYSEASETRKRLATFVIKAPKFIYGHICSHRALSRNTSSSRAIPAKRLRSMVLNKPYTPIYFGKNKPGMQSGEELKGWRLWFSKKLWLWARVIPCLIHFVSEKMGVHKELLNRMIEPWLMVDVILSGTEWENFILLRSNPSAQPEMQFISKEINKQLNETTPQSLKAGEWHIPFILSSEKGLSLDMQKKISAARCARVSYKLFDGETSNIESDLRLCDKLISLGHWSPFEHQAEALATVDRSGNFVGWKQFRKEFEL